VRGDLIRTVNKLLKRRNKFDAIIIETTGLANPAPVIQVRTRTPAIPETPGCPPTEQQVVCLHPALRIVVMLPGLS
jgi:G3E family GTPase